MTNMTPAKATAPETKGVDIDFDCEECLARGVVEGAMEDVKAPFLVGVLDPWLGDAVVTVRLGLVLVRSRGNDVSIVASVVTVPGTVVTSDWGVVVNAVVSADVGVVAVGVVAVADAVAVAVVEMVDIG